MDSRTAVFQAPTIDGNTLQNRWTATYQKAGAPDLEISGLQRIVFDGELISSLRGVWDPEARVRMSEWMAKHANKL